MILGCCILIAGCASHDAKPMTTGNGLGGQAVGSTYSGSVGAGNQAATGSPAGVRSEGTR